MPNIATCTVGPIYIYLLRGVGEHVTSRLAFSGLILDPTVTPKIRALRLLRF